MHGELTPPDPKHSARLRGWSSELSNVSAQWPRSVPAYLQSLVARLPLTSGSCRLCGGLGLGGWHRAVPGRTRSMWYCNAVRTVVPPQSSHLLAHVQLRRPHVWICVG